eukprot:3273227-Amphidinium_carterae.1
MNSEVTSGSVVQVIEAAYRPGANASHWQAAREVCERLRQQNGAHQIAFQLSSCGTSPEVRHIGYHLLLSILRTRPPIL